MDNRLRAMIKKVANIGTAQVCRYEAGHQKEAPVTERTIEYAFVFTCLAEYMPGTVLDVGSGESALPALMRGCSINVRAIDSVRGFWPYGMTNRHYYISNHDIEKAAPPLVFDCITCISALEHMNDYRAAVRNMATALLSGGIMILTFPFSYFRRVRSVYALPGSSMSSGRPYKTRAFNIEDIISFEGANDLSLIRSQNWRIWTGSAWSVGSRITRPKMTEPKEADLLCLCFVKR